MNERETKIIEAAVDEKSEEIAAIDERSIHEVVGVAQALSQLKEVLDEIDQCLDQCQFEKASDLGYDELASEFIFLQRCLGGLNDVVHQKQALIQDVCLQLSQSLENISYETISPFFEKRLDSLKPKSNPEKIDILVGPKTLEKLNSLQDIRSTPLEHLAEVILATALKENEAHWREAEESKPAFLSEHKDKKSYSCDEVRGYLSARAKQDKEREENLF